MRFPADSSNFWISNLFDGAVRPCVPLFVMLTGALVLPSERNLLDYLRKRMGRILLPALFWTIIYLAYTYYVALEAGEVVGIAASVKWLYGRLQTGAEFHLWYVYMITGIYMFIPIVGRWVRAASEQEILYFLAIWVITLFSSYPFLAKYRIFIDLQYFSGYLGYLILGYYLAHRQTSRTGWSRVALAAIVIGYIITVIGMYFVNLRHLVGYDVFFDYLTPNVSLMSAGIFYLFKESHLPIIMGIPKFIAQNSYNIYLGHILVMKLLGAIGLEPFRIMPIISVPALTVICLALISLIILVINKSFLGKYISG